jgi:hypothetical protein
MAWKKGATGNPNGRPTRGRALTEILEKTGAKKVAVLLSDGTEKRVSQKDILAALVWEAATTGKVTLPDGTTKFIADFADWMACAQFIYKHIDGPAKSELELSGNGPDGAIETTLRIVRVAARSDGEPSSD